MEGGTSEIVATATLFAMVVTKAVDLIRNAVGESGLNAPKWTWNVLAFALGITVALVWNINLLDNYGSSGFQGFGGQVFTGLAIAGSASGWHELFDTLSGAAKNAKASALVSDTAALQAGALTAGVAGAEAAVEGVEGRG